MNAACHTCEWVISHLWMSHVTEEEISIASDVVKVQGGDSDTPGCRRGDRSRRDVGDFLFSIVSASPLVRSWWNPQTVAVLYLLRFTRSRKIWRLDKYNFCQFFWYRLESPNFLQENYKNNERLQISLRKWRDIGLTKQSNLIQQDGKRSAPIVFQLVIQDNPHVKQIVRRRDLSSHLTPTRKDEWDGV